MRVLSCGHQRPHTRGKSWHRQITDFSRELATEKTGYGATSSRTTILGPLQDEPGQLPCFFLRLLSVRWSVSNDVPTFLAASPYIVASGSTSQVGLESDIQSRSNIPRTMHRFTEVNIDAGSGCRRL